MSSSPDRPVIRTPLSALALVLLPAHAAGAVQDPTSQADTTADSVPAGLILPRMSEAPGLHYPASLAALTTPPSGDVVINYTISSDGQVTRAAVATRLHPELDALALEAVLLAAYEPGTYEGQPVEVTTSTRFSFAPPPRPEPPAEELAQARATAVDDNERSLPVRLRGRLLEGGRRQPLAGASVVALPGDGLEPGPATPRRVEKWREGQGEPRWTIAGTTDADGNFELRGVPDGRVLLVFLTEGFDRLEHVVDLRTGMAVEGRYYAVRMPTNPYRTVVEVEPEPPTEVVQRVATPAEIARAPGSRGDALVGLQNFPGMARTPFGIGTLVIRGAAPGDSAVYLGGHEIPQLFHYGGLKSVFNSDLIADVAYVPSNFDAKFGDATGGVVNVTPRGPRRDGIHGYANLDLVDASALLEGKAGKGGFSLSARRSHLDLVLGAIDAVPLAPRYWDYQGSFEYPVGPGTLTVRALGSDDKFVALSDLGAGINVASGFHRGDLAYRQRIHKWNVLASPSFIHDFNESFGNVTKNYTFSLRGEARWSHSDAFGLVFGTETRLGWSDIALTTPPPDAAGAGPPGSAGASMGQSDTRALFAVPAVYATANIRLGKTRQVTLSPSVRLTSYAAPMGKFTADPRAVVAWKIDRTWTLKAGTGLYSQAPALSRLDETFGNPDLAPEKSWQSSAAVAVALPRDVSIEVTGFYKVLWDLAQPSATTVMRGGLAVPERYASSGRGRSYGGELLVRRDFSRRLYGWLAYTLSRTEIRGQADEPYNLANFDQTHILTLVGGYKLPRGWTIGTRFRLTSGNPTTPQANAIYDAGTGQWQAFSAPRNSGRLPLFHQLDLRVDKTWTLRRIRMLLYLDIQNLYYAKNAEFIVNSYDSRQSARVTSLPILPSLGLRIDW